ncbi:transmembrane protein [Anaeramoeba flamelloides]|uniref:Transmembrane protein n=1 Tax=Anaeramoeba flamelloides TaxID=1746091 RepID=A0ABQ8Y1W8_9EUKA|nr:transmembrane protein [Anaeramoeba flamelloides]
MEFENISKNGRRLFFLVANSLLLLVVLLLLFFAPKNEVTKQPHSDTYTVINQQTNKHSVVLEDLSQLNRYLSLSIVGYTNSTIGVIHKINVSGSLYGSSSKIDNQEQATLVQKLDITSKILCLYPNTSTIRECVATKLFTLPHLKYPNYYFDLTTEIFSSSEPLQEIKFEYQTVPRSRSILFVTFKSIFAFFYLGIFVYVLKKYTSSSANKRSYEAKWVPYLVLSLFFWNNPFHAAVYTLGSKGWRILELIFESIFYSLFLLFCLCAFDMIRKKVKNENSNNENPQNKRLPLLFYLPKIIFAIVFDLMLTFEALFGRIKEWGFGFNQVLPFSPSDFPFFITALITQFIALFWLIYLFLRARIESKSYPELNNQHITLSYFFFTFLFPASMYIILSKSIGLTNSSFYEFTPLLIFNIWVIFFLITYFPFKKNKNKKAIHNTSDQDSELSSQLTLGENPDGYDLSDNTSYPEIGSGINEENRSLQSSEN